MADVKQLTAQAQALKAQGRLEQAIGVHRQIVALSPKSAVAEHNLASALGDAGRWRDAETHARAAFAKGGDAPEMWLVLARALQSLRRHDEAEVAYKEALKRRPTYYDAHKELAQLRWMRSGDIAATLADLEAAIRTAPSDARLQVVKANVLQHAGRASDAHALLAALASAHPQDVAANVSASQIAASTGDQAGALFFAERAAALAPLEPVVAVTLISACLAAGEPGRASMLADSLIRSTPHNQHAIALQATAWRLLGDWRYRELYDYDAFVRAADLDTPKGWANLGGYLADLAEGLRQAHGFVTHPFNQSVRHGSQVSDILQIQHPALTALPQALDGPIRSYIASLGAGGDPLRARNRGGYAYQGVWSIRMGAGGFHIDHVHPEGWLSSACYIEVPQGLQGKEGWIKFGQPGVPTTPALEAEHFVEPKSGRLVLFPSYMWHGTVSYTAPATRMTVAFDLAPAQSGGAAG